MTTLKILTLNVFADKQVGSFDRLTRQMSLVAELDADVICLQETYDREVQARYAAQFGDYRPYVYERSSDGWVHRICSWAARGLAMIWPRMNGVKEILDGDRHGLMILLHSRLGLDVGGSLQVQSYATQCGGGHFGSLILDFIKPKGFMLLNFKVNDVRVALVNTHLANGVVNSRRMRQVEELRETVARACATTGGPAIVCCDANADGDTQPEMLFLRRQTGWQDSYVVMNPANAAGWTWDNRNPLAQRGLLSEPDQRVDMIYAVNGVSHELKVIESKIVFNQPPFVSDHYGLLTVVQLG